MSKRWDPREDGKSATTNADLENVFPCSLAQQRFWFLNQLEPDNTALNVAMRWRVTGPIGRDAIERALNALIERHEILRTRFVSVDGEPFQQILPSLTIKLPVIDLTRRPAQQARDEAEAIGANEARKPFDLEAVPLLRATLLRVAANDSILLITFHHLIVDGWSVGVLIHEFRAIMSALVTGQPADLPELELQYADYALWQNEYLESADLARARNFWRTKLAGMRRFELPTDKQRPANFTHEGAIRSLPLPRELAAALQAQAAKNGHTLFALFGAALATMLQRQTGSNDVVIGTQVAGRDSPEVQNLVGPLINTVVLRIDASGNPTFAELAARYQAVLAAALENARMPFEALVDMLKLPRDLARTPVYAINFIMEPGQMNTGDVEELRDGATRIVSIPSHSAGTLYDLNFFATDSAEGWSLSCEGNTDLFEIATIDRLLEMWRRAMEIAAASPNNLHLAGYDLASVSRQSAAKDVVARAVPEPHAALPKSDIDAGAGAIAARVTSIWRELLQDSDIDSESHFFESGGHSLLALRMIARVRKVVPRPVVVADLFRFPKLGDFVALLTGSNALAPSNSKVVQIQPDGHRPPIVVLNNAWDLFPLSKALPPDQPLISVQFVDREIAEPKEPPPFSEIVDDAVKLIREARPHGPYVLMGHCVLGAVALEAGRRLRRQGDDVKLVVMLDTEPNRIFKNVSWRARWANRLSMEVRRARWYVGMMLDGRINAMHALKRYNTAKRLGIVRVASLLGFKDRWNTDDFHTQHVVDAWQDYPTLPYDGAVALYRAMPHEREGFLDRWIPWIPAWKNIFTRVEVMDVKVAHAAIFHEPAATVIGPHLTKLLDEIASEQR